MTRHWLVDSWAPAGYEGIPAPARRASPGPVQTSSTRAGCRRNGSRPAERVHLGSWCSPGSPCAAGGAGPRAQALQVALALTAGEGSCSHIGGGAASRGSAARRLARRRSPSPRSCFRRITGGSTAAVADRHEPAQTVENVVDQVHLTPADRRAVNATLVAFVRTGVTRDDPAAAWDLATPAMRSSGTRKQWNARRAAGAAVSRRRSPTSPSWNVLSAYPGDVTIDLLLQPRPTSKRGPIAFAVELKQAKKGGRWLVDSMIPEQALLAVEPGKRPRRRAPCRTASRRRGAGHHVVRRPGSPARR